jgi:glycosyltransferase involved in cell wall biosynthesis
MRIAIEANLSWRNRAGTGSHVRGLFGTMEKIAPEHTYLYLADPMTPSRTTSEEGTKSTLQRLINGLRQMAWLQVSLARQVRASRAHLFHAPAGISPFWQPCPTVITVHDLAILRYPETFDPLWRVYAMVTLRLALPRAEAVIAISESTRRDISEYFSLPTDRVHVIHNGYDRKFRPIADQERLTSIRHRLGLPERFVLSVGTLEPRKNISRLLEAFRHFKSQSDIPHKLVLAGDRGWLHADILEQIQSLALEQEVLFTGYVDDDDLPLLYSAAEMLVYPSLYEGFGLPPLEAMACGCPVVTSDVSSLPEVVGDAAIRVDPYDVAAIARAMADLLNRPDLRAGLVEQGLQRARLFSWERAATETLQVYSCIARNPVSAGREAA